MGSRRSSESACQSELEVRCDALIYYLRVMRHAVLTALTRGNGRLSDIRKSLSKKLDMLEEAVRVFDVFDDPEMAISICILNRSGTSRLRIFESEPSTKNFARWFVFADPLKPHFKTMINQLILPQRAPIRDPPNKKIDSTGLHSILFCCLSVGIVLVKKVLVTYC